jgi:hypothetical protein
MGLYMFVYLSFNCKLLILSLYIWYFSNVFMRGPFFCRSRMLSVSSMFPYVYLWLNFCLSFRCLS